MSRLNCRFRREDRFAKKRGFWLAHGGFAAAHPLLGLRPASRDATLAYFSLPALKIVSFPLASASAGWYESVRSHVKKPPKGVTRQPCFIHAEKTRNASDTALEHCNFETLHTNKMLWPCRAKRSKAREIGVGERCSPLSDNLKAKLL